MLNLVCAFSAHSTPPTEEKSVVRVGALERESVQTFQPENASFSALMAYVDANKLVDHEAALRQLNYFLYNRDDLSAVQVFELYLALSEVQQLAGRYKQARVTLEQAESVVVSLSAEEQSQARLRKIERSVALYRTMLNYPMVIASLENGVEQAQIAGLNVESLRFCLLLASQLLQLQQLDEARRWLTRARHYAEDKGTPAQYIWYLMEKASWHLAAKERFLAQETLKRAISASAAQGLTALKFQAQLQLAKAYRLQKKYVYSEPLLQSLFEWAQKRRDRSAQFYVLKEIVASELAQRRISQAANYWQAMADQFRYVKTSKADKAQLELESLELQLAIFVAQKRYVRAQNTLAKIDRRVPKSINRERSIMQLQTQMALGHHEDAQQTAVELMANLLEQQGSELTALHHYRDFHRQQTILNQQQRLARQREAVSRLEYEVAKTQRKAQYLMVLVIFLLNLLGLYYVWRQYGGLWRNDNLYRDPLTQLPNYRAMCEAGYDWIGSRSPFCLLLFDLDRFSVINKRLGFRRADSLLIQVSTRLNTMMRHGCRLYRYQGDSFVVLAPGFDQAQGHILAERLRIELNIIGAEIQSNYIELTGSFAVLESDGSRSLQTLLDVAKQALDYTKASGRNRTALG